MDVFVYRRKIAMPKRKGKNVDRTAAPWGRQIGFVLFLILISFLIGVIAGMEGYLAKLVLNIGKVQNARTYGTHTGAVYGSLFEGKKELTSNGTASIIIPAVMANDTGVYAVVHVRAVKGKGRIYVRIGKVLVNDDTQQSIRKAALVAAKLADINLSKVDLYYDIEAPATELEGGSGGASIAVATYAALTGRKLRDDVMMTGSINHDGTIGAASKIAEKAKVADSLHMKYFLVPRGLKQLYDYKEREFCYEWQKGVRFCDVEYVPVKTALWNLSVKVVEVGTIQEALRYFLEDNESELTVNG